MAFMIETRNIIKPTRAAMTSPQLQADYYQCWQGIRKISIRKRKRENKRENKCERQHHHDDTIERNPQSRAAQLGCIGESA
jgi:hypothetical protein